MIRLQPFPPKSVYEVAPLTEKLTVFTRETHVIHECFTCVTGDSHEMFQKTHVEVKFTCVDDRIHVCVSYRHVWVTGVNVIHML